MKRVIKIELTQEEFKKLMKLVKASMKIPFVLINKLKEIEKYGE